MMFGFEKEIPFRDHGVVKFRVPDGEAEMWIPHCQKGSPHLLCIWVTMALTNKRIDTIDTKENEWPQFVSELHQLGSFERITVKRGIATECEITLRKFRAASFNQLDLVEEILRRAVEKIGAPEEKHYNFA